MWVSRLSQAVLPEDIVSTHWILTEILISQN